MRKRRQKRRGSGCRRVLPRRHLAQDDMLFDEREMEFAGAGEEKAIVSER
jgi:hypothetical protein